MDKMNRPGRPSTNRKGYRVRKPYKSPVPSVRTLVERKKADKDYWRDMGRMMFGISLRRIRLTQKRKIK